MNRYDVAVVGAGPVGSFVAKKIATEGYKVLIIEEHKKVGMPLKCAGLVTTRVFDLGDFSKKNVVQNKIYGANIHSPSGNTLSIGGDKAHALAIARSMFDEEIVKQAKNKGADVFLESKVNTAQETTKEIILNLKQKETTRQISCNLLIGADGANSKIRKAFNFPQPREILQGIGAEAKDTNLDPKYVEIFVGNKIAPGFFAWIIPTNNKGTEARVGLCIPQNSRHPPKHYFSKMFTNDVSSYFLKDAEITQHIGGSIPFGPLKKTVDQNVMLVGDAAAQVKPTSGGGIYMGLLCAKHCSSVAIEALNKKTFNIQTLKKYHNLWTSDIGRELQLGMKFRRIFKKLSDKQIDKYVKKLNNQKIIDIINRYGDIDYPSKLLFPLVKKAPSLLRVLLPFVKPKKNQRFDGGGGGT